MTRLEGLDRVQLEKMADLFLNMCLHFCGAEYTESVLRSRGFGDRELAAIGFDVDGYEPDCGDEWAGFEACMGA